MDSSASKNFELTAAVLHIIAMTLMLMDHLWATLLPAREWLTCAGRVAFISAFLNNTPVVVIFAPIIKHWAKSVNLPATKFLIPLSYVTILGGICTLIGTSTNLVVHGMILEAGFEG